MFELVFNIGQILNFWFFHIGLDLFGWSWDWRWPLF
jgi:hypothetical protein